MHMGTVAMLIGFETIVLNLYVRHRRRTEAPKGLPGWAWAVFWMLIVVDMGLSVTAKLG